MSQSFTFASQKERQEIRRRGLEQFQKGQVSLEALELGKKFGEPIQKNREPKVSIRFIDEQVGHGAFAEEDLESGQYVGEYKGLVRENIRVYFAPLNNYCYEYPVLDRLGRSYVIDATEGNFTRYINHSYEPNLSPCYAFLDGFYHVVFLALRPIRAGEQLSFNYGSSYWCLRSPPQGLA